MTSVALGITEPSLRSYSKKDKLVLTEGIISKLSSKTTSPYQSVPPTSQSQRKRNGIT